MFDLGIDVRVEAVGLGPSRCSRKSGLLLDELDLDDRLDALEAVLPRHDEADRRAVLVHQRLAIETDGEDGQRMHRLVHAQSLDIGPPKGLVSLARHFPRAEKRGERDVGRLALRLGALKHAAERDADPRNDHRPGLHAAQPVDAFLELLVLDQILELIGRGLVAEAVDLDGPGRGLERSGVRAGDRSCRCRTRRNCCSW